MDPSTPLLLYAIYDPDRRRAEKIAWQEEITGVDERPVRSIGCGSLAILASPIDPSASWIHAPTVETVLAFKSVVDRAFDVGPVIPLRFGTVVDSPSRALAVVSKKQSRYQALLEDLEGKAEVGLRLSMASRGAERGEAGGKRDADKVPGAGDRPGTSYLLSRRRRLHRARQRVERAVAPFRDGLASLTVAMTASAPEDAGAPVSVAFLILRTQEAAFRSRVKAITAPDVDRVDVVGPWPPYSFVQPTDE